jgi:hypothetical protein
VRCRLLRLCGQRGQRLGHRGVAARAKGSCEAAIGGISQLARARRAGKRAGKRAKNACKEYEDGGAFKEATVAEKTYSIQK